MTVAEADLLIEILIRFIFFKHCSESRKNLSEVLAKNQLNFVIRIVKTVFDIA